MCALGDVGGRRQRDADDADPEAAAPTSCHSIV